MVGADLGLVEQGGHEAVGLAAVLHAFADSRLVCGVNQSVWQLSAAQAAMSPDDQITVLTFDRRATAPPGVRVVVVSPLGIPAALARLRPDVLHLHSVLRPALVIATLAAQRLGIPVVASPRGGYAPRAIARRNSLKRWYARSVELPHLDPPVGKARLIACQTFGPASSRAAAALAELLCCCVQLGGSRRPEHALGPSTCEAPPPPKVGFPEELR